MRQAAKSVLVLHQEIEAGARADEMDTLMQAGQIAAALQNLGWSVSSLATGLDLAATLAAIRQSDPDCIFNLVESLAGDGRMIHFIPALLPSADAPFTGSGSDAIYLSSHKLLAKNWMRLHGMATPAFFTLADTAGNSHHQWIVKSVWEHASFGLDDGCVVSSVSAAKARIEECMQRHGGDWFAEQFIDGREFNISVLEQQGQPCILPIAEMTFFGYPQNKPKIVGYAAKWDEHAAEYNATRRVFPALSADLRESLVQTVERCWTSFGLKGYARVDIRLDAAAVPWVLEINANPCLAQDAGYVAAARAAGMSYEQIIDAILQAALNSGSRRHT
jgi:D-alanine-D-alanine ligase